MILSNIPIYWINLNRSPDRKQKMINQLNEYNIKNNKRIEAIDGLEFDNELYCKTHNVKSDLSPFELCCTLSHLKAIETAYNDNQSLVLIMEDDCSFEYLKYKNKTLQELINIFNNWDIIQLAICCRPDHNARIAKTKELLIKRNYSCATCYLINRNCMYKILNRKFQIGTSEDTIYKNNIVYMTKPYMTYYYSNEYSSTIHNMGDNSKQTKYKREDESKKFWDNYYKNL